MELKEDVAVLNSGDDPTEVQFFQIKKHEQSGVWSWTDLLREATKTASPSTLAKLYSRRHSLKTHKTRLCFISNVGFKVPLVPGSTLQFSSGCCLLEFHEAGRKQVRSKIAAQLALSQDELDLDEFSLERTNLPLSEQDVFIAGKLSKLNDDGLLSFKITRPSIAAQMLASEIQQRGSKTDFANTVDKLKQRCLSKSEMTNVLLKAEGGMPSTQTLLDEAIQTLDGERFRWGLRDRIKREKVRVCAHVTDRTNVQVQGLLDLLSGTAISIAASLDCAATLGDCVDQLVSSAHKTVPQLFDGVGEAYVYTVALLVLKYGYKEDTILAETGSQLENEE